MSDTLNIGKVKNALEGIDKEKVAEILSNENRVAVNMDKVKEGYDARRYSMENTNAEIRFIDQVLATEEMEVLSSEEYRSLKTVRGRNMSHALVNQQKFTGDSKAMERVKNSIMSLEKLLSEKKTDAARLSEVETAFVTAMEMCDQYANSKNPWFSKGIKRKEMVITQRRQLFEEYNLFRIGRNAFKNKLGKVSVVSPEDLITLGREREEEIDSYMHNYRLYFDYNLSEGEKVYQDMCERNKEIEKKTAPELSPDLKYQLDLEIFYDQDVYVAVESAQKYFKSEDAPHVENGMRYMQVNYILDIEEAYKDMHKDEARYEKQKDLFDVAFKKLNACGSAGDSISFIQSRILSVKMSGRLSEEDDQKLTELMDYYSDLISANNAMGGMYRTLIKKLAAFEPLDQDDIAILGNEVTAERIKSYQDLFTADMSIDTKKNFVDEMAISEDRKNSLDDFVKKREQKKADDLKSFREHEKKAHETMKKEMAELKAKKAKSSKELESYRSGMALEEITDEERQKNYKDWVDANREAFKEEQKMKAIYDRRQKIANERMQQALKDYDQKMDWYNNELRLQREYIAWYEKNHKEPEIIRKVQARYDKVKQEHAKKKGGLYFWDNIRNEMDFAVRDEFNAELRKWLEENGYTDNDLENAFESWGKDAIQKKLADMLEEYRPGLLAGMVKKERDKAEEEIDYEQSRQIKRPIDMYMSREYRAFRMNRLKKAKIRFDSGLEEFSKGEKKQALMESATETLFTALYDFTYNNRAMTDEQMRDFNARMQVKKDEFESQHKWTDLSENVAFLQDLYKEMEVFIQKEDKLVDQAMIYKIREDDKAMVDERMQDYLFNDIIRGAVKFYVMKPTFKYPGVKHIEEPQRPKLVDYIPTVEEVEEIMNMEEGIKANQKHSSKDN